MDNTFKLFLTFEFKLFKIYEILLTKKVNILIENLKHNLFKNRRDENPSKSKTVAEWFETVGPCISRYMDVSLVLVNAWIRSDDFKILWQSKKVCNGRGCQNLLHEYS